MELKGKCIAILEMKSGEGKKGAWQKQDFVIEYEDGKYTKKAVFTAFGDLVNDVPELDQMCSVEFNVDAREYNGNWYPVMNAWRIKTSAPAKSNSDLPF